MTSSEKAIFLPITTVDTTGSSYSTKPSRNIPGVRDFDYVVRISGSAFSESSSVSMVWAHTQSFVAGLERAWESRDSFEMSALLGVIRWQQHVIDYNGQYVAYLLEQISEEDFEQIASEIAYSPRDDIDADDLAKRIRTVISLTGIDFSASDFAGMFQCSQAAIERALAKDG